MVSTTRAPPWRFSECNGAGDNQLGHLITCTDKMPTNLNSGKEWSLADLGDLANCIFRSTSVEETADFLCREVDEVRAKMVELKTRLDGYR
jgi:hypothetical protein